VKREEISKGSTNIHKSTHLRSDGWKCFWRGFQ